MQLDVEMMVKVALLILTHNVIKNKAELAGHIVGGEFAKIGDYPHSAFIYVQKNRQDSQCGASILNQGLLLTAAHCIPNCEKRCKISAFTGSIRELSGVMRSVTSYKIHEHYDEIDIANDIALLRLKTPLKLGKRIKRIMIIKNPPKCKIAEVAGWGQVDDFDYSPSSPVLKHTKQLVYDRESCQAIVPDTPIGTICGLERSYPHSGDSGSALVIKHRTIQIGIVSYTDTAYSNETLIYTDVAYFYNWIIAHGRELYCKKNWETLKSATACSGDSKRGQTKAF